MRWDMTSFQVGGTVVVPHSFTNSKEPGEIVSLTPVGMGVLYNKGKPNQQRAFYAFAFLQQQYGDYTHVPPKTANDDLNDSIPF